MQFLTTTVEHGPTANGHRKTDAQCGALCVMVLFFWGCHRNGAVSLAPSRLGPTLHALKVRSPPFRFGPLLHLFAAQGEVGAAHEERSRLARWLVPFDLLQDKCRSSSANEVRSDRHGAGHAGQAPLDLLHYLRRSLKAWFQPPPCMA